MIAPLPTIAALAGALLTARTRSMPTILAAGLGAALLAMLLR